MRMTNQPASIHSESQLLRQADTLLQTGHFDDALVMVDEVLKRDSTSFRAWVLRGEVLRLSGRPKEALIAFRKAYDTDPHDDWLLARISETYRDLGNFPHALTFIDRALDISPESVFALAVKGELLRAVGQYEQAMTFLDRALELNGARANEAVGRAELLRTQQRYEESLQSFDLAMSHFTNSGWVLASKAEALHAQGELIEALGTTELALATRQRQLDLLSEKAEMLRRVGHFNDALACYDIAQMLLQQSSRLVGTRALILADLERYEEADENFLEAIELHPDYWLWWLRRGTLLQAKGQWREAQACLERAIEIEPRTMEAVATYIQLLCLMGKFDEARAFVADRHTMPSDDWFLFLQSVIDLYTNSSVQGQQHLRNAIRLAAEGWKQTASSDQRLRYLGNLALYYLVARSDTKAKELYEKFRQHATPRQCLDAVQDLYFVKQCGLVEKGVEELVAYLS